MFNTNKIDKLSLIVIFYIFCQNNVILKAQNIYAISKTNNQTDYLSTVDPITGNVSILSANPIAKYFSSGVSTIDPINNRFFFMSSGDTLYSVDLNTGNLLHKNRISNSPTYGMTCIEYNCFDSTLYAISKKSSNQTDYLSTVDPITGNVSILSPNPIAKYFNSGVSTIDPINNRFFFMVADTLFNIDLNTGNLLYKNRISNSPTYGITCIEYKYFCGNNVTNINLLNNSVNKLLFSPNPFKIETTINIDTKYKNSILLIYNSIGKKVIEIEFGSKKHITIKKKQLGSNGVYFAHLLKKGKLLSFCKLIVLD